MSHNGLLTYLGAGDAFVGSTLWFCELLSLEAEGLLKPKSIFIWNFSWSLIFGIVKTQLSWTGGSCLKSPKHMTLTPPNGLVFPMISCIRMCTILNNEAPTMEISSIIMSLTLSKALRYSKHFSTVSEHIWLVVSAIWNPPCRVIPRMLKAAFPVNADKITRSLCSSELSIPRKYLLTHWLIDFIKLLFPVPESPTTTS